MLSKFDVLACALTIALASCTDSGNQPILPPVKSDNRVLVPLQIGNSWTYKVDTFDTTGSLVVTDTITRFIASDTTISGLQWYLLSVNLPSVGLWGIRNDSIGYHETNWEYVNYTYQYPPRLGSTLDWWTVASVDTVVSTSLGNLHCCEYVIDWYGFPNRTLIAPGIGVVRTESSPAGINVITQTEQLISFHIAT